MQPQKEVRRQDPPGVDTSAFMKRLQMAASRISNPLDKVPLNGEFSQLQSGQSEINAIRNQAINDKAARVSLLELVQLPPVVQAISHKDNTFEISKLRPQGLSKQLKRPVKFTILAFDRKDVMAYKSKAFLRRHFSEGLNLFQDVNKVRSGVSILVANQRLVSHQGDLHSKEV